VNTPTEDFSDYLNTAEVPREDAMVSPDDSMNQDIDATNAGIPEYYWKHGEASNSHKQLQRFR
jgi:hypothetical protein